MKIKVTNRSHSGVIYTIPEDNLTRFFAIGESKMIDHKEIEKLTFQPGGPELLKNYLLVEDEKTVVNTIGEQEPEYNMTESQIKDVLLNGSYDRFLDVLDFAPEGVIDIIKDLAVNLPLTDTAKMGALKRKTGFDVAKAIELAKETAEETEEAPKKQRRVAVENTAPVRRTAAE